ncbi:MAG: TylF/MycF/NovP-related O-methyltransferase, partial [Candidatus Hodarchaeota archaeon]
MKIFHIFKKNIQKLFSFIFPQQILNKITHKWRQFQFIRINKVYDFNIWGQIKFLIKNIAELNARINYIFMAELLRAIQTTQHLKGNIIELGSFECGTTIIMARYLKAINSDKKIYACDTFSGFPYIDKFSPHQSKTQFSQSKISYIEKKLKKYDVSDKIILIKGTFENTLLSRLGGENFSLAFVDCDLYQSTKYSLNFLKTRMLKDGKIIFHDYDSYEEWGLTKAVNEWCRNNNIKLNLNPIPFILF